MEDKNFVNDTIINLSVQTNNIDKLVRRDKDLSLQLGDVLKRRLFGHIEKELKNKPNKIVELSEYINKYIPQLDNLVSKYTVIKSRGDKGDKTKKVLEETEVLIKELGNKVKESYILLKEDERIELEETVNRLSKYLKEEEVR